MSYPRIIHPLTKTLAVDGTRPKCRFCEFTFRRICWAQSHPGNTQVPPGCACVVIFRSDRNVNFEPTPLNLFPTSTLAPDQRHSIGGCVAARPDHQCSVLQCQPSNSRRSDQLWSCNAAYSKHLPTNAPYIHIHLDVNHNPLSHQGCMTCDLASFAPPSARWSRCR